MKCRIILLILPILRIVTSQECTSTQYTCKDGSCIDSARLCDKFRDCPGGEDEEDDRCTKCRSDEFQCSDGICVNRTFRCDRVKDCADNSDETGCPYECSSSDFKCDNGECVSLESRCNGVEECIDGTDERGCTTSSTTTTTEQIPDTTRFSTTTEYIDTTRYTPYTISPFPFCNPRDQFTCRRNGQCIPLRARCDGHVDCLDYTDEDAIECGGAQNELNLKVYPSDQIIKEVKKGREVVFQCRDEGPLRARVQWFRGGGLPLPPYSRDFNGRLEMPNIQLNHSGTYHCRAIDYLNLARSEVNVFLNVEQTPELATRPPRACAIDEATCANGDCVPKSAVCNGQHDCLDGSDEMRCSLFGCEPNQFRCRNNRCVQKTWRCDSEDDCGDKSDEENCDITPPGSACRGDEFECREKHQCIPRAFHCDNEIDCIDASDEVGCSEVEIRTPPPPMSVLDIGATFIITCTAVGTPTPEIIWRLNWGHIPAKCKTTSVNGFGTLECPDIQDADQGAYSCEAINSKGSKFAVPDTILVVNQREPTKCPLGTFNELANSTNDCISCFCFGTTTECKSADLFVHQFLTPVNEFRLLDVFISATERAVRVIKDQPSFFSSGLRTISSDSLQLYINNNETFYSRNVFPYFSFPQYYFGNALASYGGYIKFTLTFSGQGQFVNTPNIILSGNGFTLFHNMKPFAIVPDKPVNIQRDVSVRIFHGYWTKEEARDPRYPYTGGYFLERAASREDIMMTLANLEFVLIKAQFMTGSIINTTITNLQFDTARASNTGLGQAVYVEECRCPRGYIGLSCEGCAPGYLRRSQGPWLGECHKPVEVCPLGTYGDPSRGIPCNLCPCPLTNTANQFSQTCSLDTDGEPTCNNCPQGYEGRRCERCSPGYTGNPLLPGGSCRQGPCDVSGSESPFPDPVTGQCKCKDSTTGLYCNQCKANTFYLSSENVFGCISCFCMGATNQCSSSHYYRQQITSSFTRDSQEFKIVDRRNLRSPITDIRVNPIEQELVFIPIPVASQQSYYWSLPYRYLGDKITSYGGKLSYVLRYVPVPGGQSSRSNAPDIEIISEENKIRLLHFGRESPSPNKLQPISVPILEQYFQRPDGQTANREHLLMALANLSSILIKGSYTTSIQETALKSVSLDIAEIRNTGQSRAHEVEECSCPIGYRGLSCQYCDAGFTRLEHGLYLGACDPCECHGHSTDCDPETGVCFNCANHTTGADCGVCEAGYTGNPERGEPCRPIYPSECTCDPRGSLSSRCDNGQCICKTNVIGQNCDECRPSTFDLQSSHVEGCLSCYCSGVTDQCKSSNLFITQIPMQIIDQHRGFSLTDSNRNHHYTSGFLVNNAENQIGYDYTSVRGQRLFWSLPADFTGNKVTSYGGNLTWTQNYTASAGAIPNFDTDIVIIGNGISIYWSSDTYFHPNTSQTRSVSLVEGSWRRLTPSGPQRAVRSDMMAVLSAIEAILIRASYSSHLTYTYLSDVSLDTAIPQVTGQARATQVEVCRCPEGYKGTSCEVCAQGYYRTPLYNSPKQECRKCPCNNHEDSCVLAPDFQVLCKCLSGYSGRFCEIEGVSTRVDVPLTDTTPDSRDRVTLPQPTITVSITDQIIQIVAVGSTVTYRCTAKSTIKKPIVSISWSKVDGSLPSDRTIDDGSGNFMLLNTVPSDSGIYLCKASDGETIATQQAVLTVGEPVAPKVVLHPASQLEIAIGDTAELRCDVTGLPLPEIEWGRVNGLPLNPGVSLKNNNLFRIPSVQKSDEGAYYCRATNKAGAAIQTVSIFVRENTVDGDDTSTRGGGDSLRLSIRPKSFTGVKGEIVRLECTGSPPSSSVTFKWSRSGGVPLPPTAVEQDGVLIIYDISPPDIGAYVCTGYSSSGSALASVNALVNILKDPKPNTLIIEPERQTVAQGSTAELRCLVTPYSAASQIEWSKVNDQLPQNAQISGTILRIPSIEVRNRGVYVCRTGTDSSYAQASAVIEVERREPPAVEIYPQVKQSVYENGSALLQCRLTGGIPSPNVVWYRANNASFTSHVERLPGGVLRFIGISQEDEGEYICTASNVAGTIESIAILEVLSLPVITLNPLGPVSVTIGQPVRIICSAKGKPTPYVSWSRVNEPPPTSNGTQYEAIFELAKAQESDSGTYVCTATNEAGSTEERIQITATDFTNDVVDIDVRGQFPGAGSGTAPSTLPDEEVVFPVNSYATLRCETGNFVQPLNIQWIREDGLQLSQEHDIRGGTLVIYNVRRADTGRYTCIGLDYSGNVLFSKTAYMRVIEPPQISLHPTRQIVFPGDDAYVNCTATGDSPIRVVWSTASRLPLPYHISIDNGILQFRRISSNDAGRYVCKASNAAGEAEAIAEVIVSDRARAPRPVLTARDRTQFTNEGSDVKLECHVDPPSEYNVTWSRESGGISRNSRIINNILYIYDVRTNDADRYICKLTSPYGSVSDYIDLQVERSCSLDEFRCSDGQCIYSRQHCDGIQDCVDNSDEIYCPKHRRGINNITLHIVSNQDDVNIGDSISLTCKVSEDIDAADIEEKVNWDKIGDTLDSNIQIYGNTLRITNISMSNTGTYKCSASTKDGLKETVYNLSVQLKDDETSTSPMTTLSVPYGKEITLNCSTDIEPPVNYTWIAQTYGISNRGIFNKKELKIGKAGVNESGVYICTVSNEKRKQNIPSILKVTNVIPSFSSKSYLQFPPLYSATHTFKISITFNPRDGNGLILYNGNENAGDYVSFGLSKGSPEFRFDVGSGSAVIRSDIPLELNKWHTIRLFRDGKKGVMEINGLYNYTGVSPGQFQTLDLYYPLYLGGVPSFNNVTSITKLYNGFDGCINNFEVGNRIYDLNKDALDSSNLNDCNNCDENPCLNEAVCQEANNDKGHICICKPGFDGQKCEIQRETCYPDTCGSGRCVNTYYGIQCHCPLGKIGKKCKKDVKISVPAFIKDSYLAYRAPRSKRLKLDLEFKPEGDNKVENGILMYMAENYEGHGDFISLSILDEKLELKYGTKSDVKMVRSNVILIPGEINKVYIKTDASAVELRVNDESQIVQLSDERHLDKLILTTPLYIGGYDRENVTVSSAVEITSGFYGCISHIEISGIDTGIFASVIGSANIQDCNDIFGDSCQVNPCLNGGSCSTARKTFKCQCPPSFTGERCENKINTCELLKPCKNNATCIGTSSAYKCECQLGFVGSKCDQEVEITTDISFKGDGYVELKGGLLPQDGNHVINIAFSTTNENGLILWHGQSQQSDRNDFFSLAVENGYTVMTYETSSGKKYKKVAGDHKVDDGSVHSVTIRRNGLKVDLELDSRTIDYATFDQDLNATGNIFIGGLPNLPLTSKGEYREGFNGCINSLQIQTSTRINFSQQAISAKNAGPCTG